MQNTECMKSSHANVDGYITEAEPGGHWRAWRDNIRPYEWRDGNKKKRLSSAPVLAQAEAAQGSQCTHFMILGARRKNGVSVGPSKPFWFIALRETEQRGRKHLLSNKTRCWRFLTVFPFCFTNNVFCPFYWWGNRGWRSRSWSWWLCNSVLTQICFYWALTPAKACSTCWGLSNEKNKVWPHESLWFSGDYYTQIM